MGLWDDLTGKTAADASNAAAADTYKKQTAAVGGLNSYSDTLPGQYNKLGSGYQPYADAGGGALQMLMNGTGANGAGGNQAYTAAYHAQPGYQAGLDTGTNAAMRGANAGNMLQSGRTLKALQRFGGDYEDQKSNSFWDHLMGLSGQGLQATGAQAGLGAQGLGTQAGLRGTAFGGEMNAAGTIGQGQVAGAQAQQAGVTNLLNAGTQLAGAALGGGMGTPKIPLPSGSLPKAFSPLPGGW